MELLLPSLFIALGLAIVIYPRKIGHGFCKFGKTIWKKATFGLTDMRWFYSEDRAPKIFRLMGLFCILFGVIFLSIIGGAFFGPNAFAAMREARIYIADKHGKSSSGWSFSATEGDQGQNSVIIKYRYGERSGSLSGVWNGDHYEFVEKTSKAEHGADDQLPARAESSSE